MQENGDFRLPYDVEGALNEIDRILHQMLILANLSASDGNIDRAVLQKTLAHMKRQIDILADWIERIS